MSEEKLTPYQIRKGMTYVKNTPDFLKNLMKENRQPDVTDKFRVEEDHVEETEDFLSEKIEERPQVVVLNEENHMDEDEVKKYYISQGKLKPEVEEIKIKEKEKIPEEDKTPAVDKDGRILFRTKRKTEESEKIESNKSKNNKEKDGKDGKKGAKKKQKNKALLSFDIE